MNRAYVIYGILAIVGLVAAFVVPDAKTAVTATCVVSFAVATARDGAAFLRRLAGAACMSLLVNVVAPHEYRLTDPMFGPVSLFSFTAWTAGLLVLRGLFRALPVRGRWATAVVLYLVGLLGIEYVGYHLLGIALTGDQPSFFGLGVLHGTPVLHVAYVLAGPLYLAATELAAPRRTAQ